MDSFIPSVYGCGLEAQRGSVTCPRSHSLCVDMCGSSSLSLVPLNKYMCGRKFIKEHLPRGMGCHLWVKSGLELEREEGETILMLMYSLLYFPAVAAHPWWAVSFEVSLLPVSQDEHDLNQPTLCLGQMEATLRSP